MRLALVGCFLVPINQNHRYAGFRGRIGNAGTHETGTNDTDLGEFGFFHTGRTTCALAQFLQGHKQRAHHRIGFRCLQNLGEIPLFDTQTRIEGHLQAFKHTFENGESSRIIAIALLAQGG